MIADVRTPSRKCEFLRIDPNLAGLLAEPSEPMARNAFQPVLRPLLDCGILLVTGVLMSKRAVYLLLITLALLHQDFWLWDDPTLVLGFLPVGLAYHAVYSLVVAGAWYLTLRYAWPSHTEAFAEERDEHLPRP